MNSLLTRRIFKLHEPGASLQIEANRSCEACYLSAGLVTRDRVLHLISFIDLRESVGKGLVVIEGQSRRAGRTGRLAFGFRDVL